MDPNFRVGQNEWLQSDKDILREQIARQIGGGRSDAVKAMQHLNVIVPHQQHLGLCARDRGSVEPPD
jgi:hypothetical protein